jgi:hypothetical protein
MNRQMYAKIEISTLRDQECGQLVETKFLLLAKKYKTTA